MTAAVKTSPPATITTDPSSDLRSSIHETIAEFHGNPVRPSMVAAAHKRKKSTTAAKDDDMDPEALHALLADLAFTPREYSDGTIVVENHSKKAQKFVFDSPVKQSDAAPTLTTPWVKRQQATPPTASTISLVDQDEDASPNKEIHEDQFLSPMRSLASPNSNHASNNSNYAAASAYVLSLPKEDSSEVGSVVTSPSVKKCKKFPTVDTNIPGAGTRRSSMSYQRGAVKMPFVHIATSTESPTALRKKQRGPANQLYQTTKGAWTWGKNHLLVLNPLMNLTEGAISWTAGLTTGNDDLAVVDHNLLEPMVGAVDQHVFSPVLGFVGGVFGGNK